MIFKLDIVGERCIVTIDNGNIEICKDSKPLQIVDQEINEVVKALALRIESMRTKLDDISNVCRQAVNPGLTYYAVEHAIPKILQRR